MEDNLPLPLQKRVVESISEAERLYREMLPVEEAAKDIEKAMQLCGQLKQWEEAVRQAVYSCRLAVIALPRDFLNDLIDAVNELDEEGDLWEFYTLAEWHDDWRPDDSPEDVT